MAILPRIDAYGVVYLIRNNVSGGVYVGQTIQDYRIRWRRHRDDLTRGVHDNPHLQRSWNKYGADAFYIEVAETVNDQAALDSAEARWIIDLRADGVNVYNLKVGGRFGGTPSPEMRQRISESGKGRVVSQETRQKIRESKIGKTPTVTPRLRAGWDKLQGRKQDADFIQKRIHASVATHPLTRFRAPNGQVHETRNVTALAREHGLHPRLLAYVAIGKQRQHRGWTLA